MCEENSLLHMRQRRDRSLESVGEKSPCDCFGPAELALEEVQGKLGSHELDSAGPGNSSYPPNATVYTYATDLNGTKKQLSVYRPPKIGNSVLTPLVMLFAGSAFAGTGKGGRCGLPYDGLGMPPEFEKGTKFFLDAGWSVAICPLQGWLTDVLFPDPLHDAVAMLRYLRGRSCAIGIKQSRIAAWGMSSGAWYAAMLGASGSDKFDKAGLLGKVGLTDLLNMSTELCAVSGMFGLYDPLTKMQEAPEDRRENQPEWKMMPPDMRNDAGWASATVETYLNKKAGVPPMFLSHGTKDMLINISQSIDLVKALDALKVETEFIPVPGANHGGFSPGREIFLNVTVLTKQFDFIEKFCKG